jgi:hypothetical protein
MKQALLIIDVQPCFNLLEWLIEQIARLAPTMHSIATVERHDEVVKPFWRQLGWRPAAADPLVPADKVFVKTRLPSASWTRQLREAISGQAHPGVRHPGRYVLPRR